MSVFISYTFPKNVSVSSKLSDFSKYSCWRCCPVLSSMGPPSVGPPALGLPMSEVPLCLLNHLHCKIVVIFSVSAFFKKMSAFIFTISFFVHFGFTLLFYLLQWTLRSQILDPFLTIFKATSFPLSRCTHADVHVHGSHTSCGHLHITHRCTGRGSLALTISQLRGKGASPESSFQSVP